MEKCQFCQSDISAADAFHLQFPKAMPTAFCSECASDMVKFVEENAGQSQLQVTNDAYDSIKSITSIWSPIDNVWGTDYKSRSNMDALKAKLVKERAGKPIAKLGNFGTMNITDF